MDQTDAVAGSRQRVVGLADLARIPLRRWRIVLAMTAVVVLGVVGYLQLAPARYTATSVVVVRAVVTDPFSYPSGGADRAVNMTAENGTATSNEVIDKVATVTGIPAHQVREQLQTEIPTGGQVLRFTFTGRTEAESVTGANVAAETYLQVRQAYYEAQRASLLKSYDGTIALVNDQRNAAQQPLPNALHQNTIFAEHPGRTGPGARAQRPTGPACRAAGQDSFGRPEPRRGDQRRPSAGSVHPRPRRTGAGRRSPGRPAAGRGRRAPAGGIGPPDPHALAGVGDQRTAGPGHRPQAPGRGRRQPIRGAGCRRVGRVPTGRADRGAVQPGRRGPVTGRRRTGRRACRGRAPRLSGRHRGEPGHAPHGAASGAVRRARGTGAGTVGAHDERRCQPDQPTEESSSAVLQRKLTAVIEAAPVAAIEPAPGTVRIGGFDEPVQKGSLAVLDAPPTEGSEQGVRAARAGGAVLVVALDRTRCADLDRLVERVRAAGVDPIGFVLTGSRGE